MERELKHLILDTLLEGYKQKAVTEAYLEEKLEQILEIIAKHRLIDIEI